MVNHHTFFSETFPKDGTVLSIQFILLWNNAMQHCIGYIPTFLLAAWAPVARVLVPWWIRQVGLSGAPPHSQTGVSGAQAQNPSTLLVTWAPRERVRSIHWIPPSIEIPSLVTNRRGWRRGVGIAWAEKGWNCHEGIRGKRGDIDILHLPHFYLNEGGKLCIWQISLIIIDIFIRCHMLF